jgi:hypothetical protein
MSVYYRHLIESGLLLDIYPNADIAYSLRKLRSGYKQSYNLWNYSEEIQQSVWPKASLTVTSNSILAPDGTMTADVLYEVAEVSPHNVDRAGSVIIGLDYTVSFWVKGIGRDFISILTSTEFNHTPGTAGLAWLDLSTGTIVSQNSGFIGSNLTLTPDGDWWKVSYTMPANTGGTQRVCRISLSSNGSNTSYLGDITKGMALWGFQITQSSSVLPYQKTVVAPENGNAIEVRRTSDGAELDIPFNTNGELDTDTLLDFVGANLFAYSEQIQQTYWAKGNSLVTTDVVVAPDGTTTGDILYETATNGTHTIQRALATTAGQLYTISFWIKDEGRHHIQLTAPASFSHNPGTAPIAWLDLSLGIIVSQNSGFTGANLILTPDGDWWKVSYTLPSTISATNNVLMLFMSPDGSALAYPGDITKGSAIWGLQISQSSTIRPYFRTAAIAGGQGSVSTWYDQSGNGRNASQGTVSLQAIIVANGNLITNNGKVSTLWSNDSYGFTAINTNVPIVSTYVARRNGIGASGPMTSFANNGTTIATVFRWLSTNNMTTYLNTARVHSPGNTFTGDYLLTTYKRVDEYVSIRRNNVEFASGGISTGNGALNSFGNGNGSGTTGYVNEGILWFQDYVSLIPNIETEINNYYGIY